MAGAEAVNNPKMSSRPGRGVLPYLALASGILALSLSSLFVRWAEAPGMISAFYRMLGASVVLIPVVLRRNARSAPIDRRWWFLPLLGGVFTALDHATWATSIGLTRVATATLLNNIAPLWVALVAVLIWKEKLRGWFWLGLAFTLSGAVVILGSDLLSRPHLGGGDALAVISSLFYAGYFLTTQRGRQHFDTLRYIWLVTATAAVILLVLNLAFGNPFSGYSAKTYLAFVGAALISQILGYFSVGYALGHLPAALVAPTMIAQPVLTALLAIPLAGESLLPAQILGGVAVLAGITLINRSRGA